MCVQAKLRGPPSLSFVSGTFCSDLFAGMGRQGSSTVPCKLLSTPESGRSEGGCYEWSSVFRQGCRFFARPTALPADSFFLRILLRLSEAKDSTCMMSKGESTWTVSTTWLMVSMMPPHPW